MTATRGLAADLDTALSDDVVRPMLLVEAALPSGTVRFWSGFGDLLWNSQTWTGAGTLLALSAVDETKALEATGARVTLSGISASLRGEALAEGVQGSAGAIYLGAWQMTGGTLLTADDGTTVLTADDGVTRLVADEDEDGGLFSMIGAATLFAGEIDTMELDVSGSTMAISVNVEHPYATVGAKRRNLWTDERQKVDYPSDTGFDQVVKLPQRKLVWGK